MNDPKSKRILSRLQKNLGVTTVENYFGSAIKSQTILNKKTGEKTVMHTISTADFFKVLQQKGLRKSKEPV